MTDDELDALAAEVRRGFGDRFPIPDRDESAADRDLREEITRDVLERIALPEVERQRLGARQTPLTAAEQRTIVDAHGTAAKFPAVKHHVVLLRECPTRWIASRTLTHIR